ncbi:bile acid:sodium symporter family protein [Serratia liquefaciens]
MKRPRLLPDNFTLTLLATVALASLLPCRGEAAVVMGIITNLAIGLLFFMHGAKLSRQAILAGATHWRLHLLVFSCTFILFPLVGWSLKPLLAPLVTPELYLGVLYLCALPATVQSAIAFTSLGRGNVPAAVCSASMSSLLGIFLTPLLVRLMIETPGAGNPSSFDAIMKIVVQLLLPFIAGQIMRRWIGGFVDHHKGVLRYVDQSSILLVIYTAFSAAVVEGLWRTTPLPSLAGLFVICAILLGLIIPFTIYMSRWLGFSKEDEITIVFAASKKSLASGVPMAQVLFASSAIGAILLPVMLFHQMQLMVCANLAQRYNRRVGAEPTPPASSAKKVSHKA